MPGSLHYSGESAKMTGYEEALLGFGQIIESYDRH